MRMPFPEHGWFNGTVATFRRPWFNVIFDDGDSADYTGHQIAPCIVTTRSLFYDPREFFFDWSTINPLDIPRWKAELMAFCESFGLDVPAVWLAGGAPGDPDRDRDSDDLSPITAFLRHESAVLRAEHLRLLSSARAERTISNLRNPGLKLLWFCASRQYNFPPTGEQAAWYFTFLARERDNSSAVASARNALTFLCSINDIPTAVYSSVRVNAAHESMRRKHKHQVRKAAGLRLVHVSAILLTYFGDRADGLRENRSRLGHWELALGASIALGYKLLLRYNDLKRCRFDDGYCEVFPTHIRFYLDGRKNNQYGGNFLDVAAPEDPETRGVYHILVAARDVFRTGFILASISAAGVCDTSKCMSHKSFVWHLRNALQHIGLTREQAHAFSAHSMRAGGATEAAVHKLHREDIQHLAGVNDPNWLAYYNRTYLAERLRVSRALGL